MDDPKDRNDPRKKVTTKPEGAPDDKPIKLRPRHKTDGELCGTTLPDDADIDTPLNDSSKKKR